MTVTRLSKYKWFLIPLTLVFCCGVTKTSAQETNTQKNPGFWEGLRELHQKAIQSEDQVPTNFMEWVKEDIQRTGSWEYRIVSIQAMQDAELEKKLNQWGGERWEVFWIQPVETELRLYLKRPKTAYLKSLPLSEYLQLLPDAQQDSKPAQ